MVRLMSNYYAQFKKGEIRFHADVDRLVNANLDPRIVADLFKVIEANNKADGHFFIYEDKLATYIERNTEKLDISNENISFAKFRAMIVREISNNLVYQDPQMVEDLLSNVYSLEPFFDGIESEKIKKLAFSFDPNKDPDYIYIDVHQDADLLKFKKGTLIDWMCYLSTHFDYQRFQEKGVRDRVRHRPSTHMMSMMYSKATESFDYNEKFRGEYYEISLLLQHAMPKLNTPEEILLMSDVMERVRERFQAAQDLLTSQAMKSDKVDSVELSIEKRDGRRKKNVG